MNEKQTSESRVFAIGDVHGESKALEQLLEQLDIGPGDTIVMLGDVINRGSDTRGVIDQLLELQRRCNLLCILGNHEQVLLEVLNRPSAIEQFLQMGGDKTLESYGNIQCPSEIAGHHLKFIRGFVPYVELEECIFVHANYCWYMPMNEQPASLLRWTRIEDEPPQAHISGKRVICGHSPGPVRDMGYYVCIDTGCGFGGKLTCISMHSREHESLYFTT